ncbi:uncharacterized protein LOC126184622 isoform X2 [Schistocerca cancellata]|uniref:uncharacterized protein LOC126184622 isoform X2 n=1 Tax=Schistocerca cancellata TaxID=274614 RepID=UPI0021173537|nr:uncharacterized protein LOC126184622 isoform X2 [Schistocerca cancellata]
MTSPTEKLEAKRGRDSLTCIFCHSDVEEDCQYGKLYCRGKITVHYFCLLLATKLDQKGNDREGILGFLLKDIEKQINAARNVRCCYCNRGGATVYCCGNTCKKVFHLPCGLKEQSFHEFYGRFRSFCSTHRRTQVVDRATLIDAAKVPQICTICYETVIPKPSPDTLWAPCCKKNAWFHKTCVQMLALNAGYFFKCPLCNNKRMFHSSMKKNGIFIPEQDASWERVPHAFDDMYTTYQHCDAVECHCKKGRSYCERRTVFEIIVCKYCGSQGVHKKCGELNIRDKEWGCPLCTNALTSGHSRSTSTASNAAKSCSDITFNVQEFFSSTVSRRFLPQVRLERKLNVPPSVRIGEASLKILKGSYQSRERSNEITCPSKPQVVQCDQNCLQSKSDLSVPGCPLWEQEAAQSCAPKKTDNCNRKLIGGCKVKGKCMKETISSDSQSGSANGTICLKKKSGVRGLKRTQGAKNQTSLSTYTETSMMTCHYTRGAKNRRSLSKYSETSTMISHNNVNDLPFSVQIDNMRQSPFRIDKPISFSPGSANFFSPGSANFFSPGSANFFSPGSANFFPPGAADFFRSGSADFFRSGSADFFPPGCADFFRSGSANLQNFRTHAVVPTDVASPESKKVKKVKMCSPNTFSRELKDLGVRRKHVYLTRGTSFTRSGNFVPTLMPKNRI